MTLTYSGSGVDTEKAANLLSDFRTHLANRPQDQRVLSGLGPFAACYDAQFLKEYDHPILVSCCDGVGTKVKLAMDWDQVNSVGQDLVAMNVNDLLCAGAAPLFFLDYYATGKLNPEQTLRVLKGVQRGCELADCALIGGETAEMPGVYQGTEFDLAGFCVGVAERDALLGPHRVEDGDTLLGIASSGFHSNGYSLVRRLIEKQNISPDAPFEQQRWKDVLLEPTAIYVKALKPHFPQLHALAHLTGGGLFENLVRALPTGAVAQVSWKFPKLFQWAQEAAELSTEQMLSTFNCGIGMIAIAPDAAIEPIRTELAQAGVASQKIGSITRHSNQQPPQIQWQSESSS